MQTITEITRGLIIETRFLGPTNHRGSRVTAVCKRDSNCAFRKTVNWQHQFSSIDNHRTAAEEVLKVMGTELDYAGAEPFRIVACGYGGSSDASYYWLINRGGA